MTKVSVNSLKKPLIGGLLLMMFFIINSVTAQTGCNFLCNTNFEDSIVTAPGGMAMVPQSAITCWSTSEPDGLIEVWNSGFNGVTAYSGVQFIELNANVASTLYQDFYAGTGANVTVGFAHRGRLGVDSMSVSIAYVGGPTTVLGVFGDNTVWQYRNLNYTIPVAGNYSLQFTATHTSTGSLSVGNFLDDIKITFNIIATAEAGPAGNIGGCDSAAGYQINGIGTGVYPLVYSWSPVAGLSDTNIATPIAHPSVTTNYFLTVTDPNGCFATDSVLVTVNPQPTANAGSDINIITCDSTAIINGSGTGATPLIYQWTPTTGLSNPNIATPSVQSSVTTNYNLTVTDPYGCKATDSVYVNVSISSININITASTNPICVGNSTTLTASGGNSYVWANGLGTLNTITVSPAVTTSYVVTGSISGCTGNDTIKIRVVPYPIVNLGPDSLICTGTTLVLTPPTPGYTYLWQDNSTAATYDASLPGTYWVQVTDSFNCTTTASVVITNLNPPAFPLPNDTSLCQGKLYNVVVPAGPYNVYWSDGTHDFYNSFSEAGTYGVTVSNKCGAINNNFTIKYADCSCYIYFPNAFTPNNGDGLNDNFGPKYQCNFYTYHLYIYNRWGQLVYETNRPDQVWDGKCKTEDVEVGVYVWRLLYTAQYAEGLQGLKGVVTVLR
ncbi:MAG: gliding motility-associated C-terminal domain-containing protein [Bacteroidota bacterium]